jgi:hypothetical protein
MKPHITNLQHQKFCILIEDVLQKLNQIPAAENIQLTEKIAELQNNRQSLEDLYSDYQVKLKQLRGLLGEYEKVQQLSRIHLRKMQLWLKVASNKAFAKA